MKSRREQANSLDVSKPLHVEVKTKVLNIPPRGASEHNNNVQPNGF